MMGSKFDKTCIVCGTKYRYCGGCSNYNNRPRWMQSFHNEDCHKIFNTIMEYRTGVKTPAECAEILRGCDLSYRDKINPDFNGFIDAIFADGNPAPAEVVEPEVAIEQAFEKAVEEKGVVQESVAEDVSNEVAEPEKPQKGYYKNYKKSSYKKKEEKEQ